MMVTAPGKPLTGRMVFLMVATAFAVIVGVNLTLAYQAVATFPGLEVRNSYVASQTFDADRAAQRALGWTVSATLDGDTLRLSIRKDGRAVAPQITSAVLGRATSVAQDVTPRFHFDGQGYIAPVTLDSGNWNLRLVARAQDGTLFRQRIIVRAAK